MPRRAFLLLLLAAAACLGLAGALDDSRPDQARAVAPAPAPCDEVTEATTDVDPRRDLRLGPLVILGARRTVGAPRDGFAGDGYKLGVTLPDGVVATLSVPRELRGRVGFVYRHSTQDRVAARGVAGADPSVRFTACPPAGEPGRTGWPGGMVTDRRRCARLTLAVAGGPTMRRGVPLGRRCRG